MAAFFDNMPNRMEIIMAKSKTAFFCRECGYESAKWSGQCPACKEWNTFVEEPVGAKTSKGACGVIA